MRCSLPKTSEQMPGMRTGSTIRRWASEGKHASPSPSTRKDSRPSSPVGRKDSRPSSPVGRKTRAAHETETEMQQSLVTEEEAAAQVEEQLALARADAGIN